MENNDEMVSCQHCRWLHHREPLCGKVLQDQCQVISTFELCSKDGAECIVCDDYREKAALSPGAARGCPDFEPDPDKILRAEWKRQHGRTL